MWWTNLRSDAVSRCRQGIVSGRSNPFRGVISEARNFPGRFGRDEGGAVITCKSGGEAELDRRLSLICTKVKDAGITLYTIMLRVKNAALRDLFRNCASKSEYFFESPTSVELNGIFETIANDLATLRIKE